MTPIASTPTTTVRRSYSVALIILGVAILVGAWGADRLNEAFASGLLVEVGVTFFLLVPLLLITRRLERRVVQAEAEVRQETQALRVRVEEAEASIAHTADELSAALRDSAISARQQVETELQDLAARDRLVDALDEARVRGWTSRFGPRVDLPNTDLCLRFGGSVSLVTVTVERIDGSTWRTFYWPSAKSNLEFFAAIQTALRLNGLYPGDGAFDPGHCLKELSRLLMIASRAEARGYSALRGIVQVFGTQWAITDDALVAITDGPYVIERSKLKELDWEVHMSGEGWVNMDDFGPAFATASALTKR